MSKWLTEIAENAPFFGKLLLAHIQITLLAVLIATALGLVIGIWISNHKRITPAVISVVNILYTIPSIALLGILISITGIGSTTAIIALTLYALLPIVRSTYTGIHSIDPKIIDASIAMGSKKWQMLFQIQLPLAFPIIYSALRNMVTMTIALASIASFVGASGLGVAIYRGITTNNKVLLLSGSILVALLALLFDALLGLAEKHLVNRRGKKSFASRILVYALCALLLGGTAYSFITQPGQAQIQVASKPTTEGYLLGEITAKVIQQHSGLSVQLTQGVGGGTSNLHPAVLRGDFDLYPEYTGTAWQIVLKEEAPYHESLFPTLQEKYEQDFRLTWRGIYGFNNTYGLGVNKAVAEKYSLKTYSDLAKHAGSLVFGAEYDFFEREDGFQALSKAYKLNFARTVDMDNGLKYQALLDQKIDVMTVFTTDGQLSDPRIVVLEDDKKFYPSYIAGTVVRMDTLQQYPQLESALTLLNGLIDETQMAKMNYRVEIENKTPEEVVKSFLQEKGLWRDE